MKQLIDTYYPGTKLAFKEWNYGDSKSYDLSQGLAVAETLGVFGRHNVDHSTFWTYPLPDAPMFQAFALFRNPAGDGVSFGSMSLPTQVEAIDAVSLYSSLNDLGSRLHLGHRSRLRVPPIDLLVTLPHGPGLKSVSPCLRVLARGHFSACRPSLGTRE